MVASLAAAFLLLDRVRGVAVPVLLSLALAWLFDPVVSRLEARGWSRTTAIGALAAVLTVVVGVAVAMVVPALVEQARRLPDYLRGVSGVLVPLLERFFDVEVPSTWRELLSEYAGKAAGLLQRIGPQLGSLLLRAVGGTASAISTILGLALVPLVVFYFLRDFPEMKRRAAELLPPRFRPAVVARCAEIDEILAAFVRGQLTVAAILGAIYAVGLTASGVKLGLVIGLLTGLASIVPFVGMTLGVALAAIAILVDWHDGSHWVAAGAAVTFVVGQVLEGNVITPRVVGEKVGLPPVVVMLAVLTFGELFGFLGLLLAVPLAAVGKVVLRVLVERYRTSRLYLGGGEGRAAEENSPPPAFSA